MLTFNCAVAPLQATVRADQWRRMCKNAGVFDGTLTRYARWSKPAAAPAASTASDAPASTPASTAAHPASASSSTLAASGPAATAATNTSNTIQTELNIEPRDDAEQSAIWVRMRKGGANSAERDAVQFYSRELDHLEQQGMVYGLDGSFCSGSVRAAPRYDSRGALRGFIVEQNLNAWNDDAGGGGEHGNRSGGSRGDASRGGARIAARRRMVTHYGDVSDNGAVGEKLAVTGAALYRELDVDDYIGARHPPLGVLRMLHGGVWRGEAEVVALGDGVDSRYLTGAELCVQVHELHADSGGRHGSTIVKTTLRYPTDDTGAETTEVVSRARLVPGVGGDGDGSDDTLIFEPRRTGGIEYEMRFYGGDCTVLSPRSMSPLAARDDATAGGAGAATAAAAWAHGSPFFVEFAWLVDANTRRRVTRHYDANGAYAGSTFVAERRVADTAH